MLPTLETCFQALFDHHRDAFTLYNNDGLIMTQNDAARRLRRLCDWEDAIAATVPRAAFAEAYQGNHSAFELCLPSHEGKLHVRVDVSPVIVDGTITGITEVARDVRVTFADEIKESERNGMPALPILYDRMSRLLMYMRRDGRPFAVHILSVQLEIVSPPKVQEAMEEIILERLSKITRNVDTVARLGRNFVIVQADLTDHESAPSLIARITSTLQSPVDIDGDGFYMKMQIGTAVAMRRTMSVDDLLAEADLNRARWRTPDLRSIGGIGGA